MKKLNLETDYKINGNSTGAPLDTLAIAVDGRDSNDIENWDGDTYIQEYVFDNYDYEGAMLKEATKADLEKWLHDPMAQADALKQYAEERREAVTSGRDTDSDLYQEVQDAIDSQRDDDYRQWIYGDHRDWAGILTMGARMYGNGDYQNDYGLEFTTEKGEVYANLDKELIAYWKEEGYIERASQAYAYLERSINDDARANYSKKQEEQKKRRAEHERLSAYKKEQAEKAEIERQERIKSLINK